MCTKVLYTKRKTSKKETFMSEDISVTEDTLTVMISLIKISPLKVFFFRCSNKRSRIKKFTLHNFHATWRFIFLSSNGRHGTEDSLVAVGSVNTMPSILVNRGDQK